jgi:hypothetical protein
VVALKTISLGNATQPLTAKQKRVLKKHTTNRMYDANGTNVSRQVVDCIFIPADYQGNPSLLLLCQVTKLVNGKFEWVIYTDGLYGSSHVPSDKFGAGTIKQAKASLFDHIGHELFGHWMWVIQKKITEARKLAGIK